MSDQMQKKKRELFLAEQFLIALDADAKVVDADSEEPDLIIQMQGNLIGIEVSELFIANGNFSGALQKQESLSERILSSASTIYQQLDAPPVQVWVTFLPSYDLRKANRNHIADRLATLVATFQLAPGQHAQWRRSESPNIPIHQAIDSVFMLGITEEIKNRWLLVSAGWRAQMSLERLQVQVTEKAKRLAKYRQRVDTNWLLLVSNGKQPSQFFEDPTDTDIIKVVSPFDSSFYFSLWTKKIFQLGKNSQ